MEGILERFGPLPGLCLFVGFNFEDLCLLYARVWGGGGCVVQSGLRVTKLRGQKQNKPGGKGDGREG